MFDDNLDIDLDDDSEMRPVPPRQTPPSVIKKPNLPPKKVIKRKFPGPAGILSGSPLSISENKRNKCEEVEVLCTQTSLSLFQKGPWLCASRDYEDLLERFNIKWIKTSARLNRLHNSKAPFLGAVIQNIEFFTENEAVFVVLKDVTGEIPGSISQSLYEEYSNDLTVGAVIILKQVSVLTSTKKNHSITITSNNLVTIYTKSKDEESDDEIKTLRLQEVSPEDFLKTLPKQTNIEVSRDDSIKIAPKQINNLQKKQEVTILQPKPLEENKVEPQLGIQNIFEDDFVIPDNFEECLVVQNQTKKFNFKKKNVTISCSQVSINTNEEDSVIWQDALEGMDADSFFEDFS